MPLIRGLDQLLADLDRRKRPDARLRNQVVTKYATVSDSVALSTDTITTQTSTAWAWLSPSTAPTSTQAMWGGLEWS